MLEAQTEIDKLEIEMTTTFEGPPTFQIG
jgi:hypothetical protein